MTLKTLLVHLDHTPRCEARVGLAARLAAGRGAHLVGLLPNGLLDGTIPADALPSGMTDYIAESARYLRERAQGISEGFRAQAASAGVGSSEVREVEGTTIGELVAHARASDLVVLGQDEPGAASDTPVRNLVPPVMLESGRPVLVVPYAGQYQGVGQDVLMAWDGSRAAAVAIRGALPLLAPSARVRLLSFRADASVAAGELLGPQMVAWLERHGLRASFEDDAVVIGIGDALLSRAADLGSDLIVMGGYGHSRLREMVLGGVTRDVLAHMTAPVLIAH